MNANLNDDLVDEDIFDTPQKALAGSSSKSLKRVGTVSVDEIFKRSKAKKVQRFWNDDISTRFINYASCKVYANSEGLERFSESNSESLVPRTNEKLWYHYKCKLHAECRYQVPYLFIFSNKDYF